ncbi:MAG: glycoside hydrolase family 28 protein [Acidomyces sp. 'richmondensis']|nr:MAG: glycoside hydrolase family 28 protein [Acidomyces sp. 'richmondensis']
MKQAATVKSVLLSAGAGLVAAAPHRFDHGQWKDIPFKFPSAEFPPGSGIAPPGFRHGGFPGFPIGTGFPTGFSGPSGMPIIPSGSLSGSSSVLPTTSSAALSTSVVKSSNITSSLSASVPSTTASSSSSSNSTGGASAGEVSNGSASSSCTFTSASDAISGKKSCTNIVLSGISVPAGTTLDMTDLSDGTTVTFEGTTTFGYEEWDGPLISFSGTDITIQGADGHVIDMEGQNWWDGEGSNGGKTKPKGFYAHDLTDSVIKGLNIKNTPVQCFSVDNAQNLQITDVTIDDSAGDVDNLGHNTDGFDVGQSTGVYISGATVYNQDDCLAINSGTDISFTGGYCSGGHGLSIGSVGDRDDNTVENIYIADSTVTASENGVRIKTISGATGSVKNVTYSNIKLSTISDYGIVIEQDYENGSPTGTPTSGVPVTELTLEDITGSVSSGANPYYILCASCSDWTVSSVDVTGGSSSDKCEGEPSGVNLC